MRIIGFMMAFMVLVLSFMPCADKEYAMSSVNAKTEKLKNQTQQRDTDESDACSPFCHCACCAGFSINHVFGTLSAINAVSGKNYDSFLPANLIEISLPIWQPPQLVS